MKQVTLYEFSELEPEIQERLKDRIRHMVNEIEMNLLFDALPEEDAWKMVGCTKEYAESTPGFLEHCHYEHNRDRVEITIMEELENQLYTKNGYGIILKDDIQEE